MANYSMYSIPIFWIVALYPHAYGVNIIKKSNNNKWNNRNPRGADTNSSIQKSVPADIYAKFERAEAAHKNSLENAPLYIGAVLAGNMAGLDAMTMNLFTGLYISLRVLYTVLYINTTTQKWSYGRTLTWLMSTLLLGGVYIKAGGAYASKS